MKTIENLCFNLLLAFSTTSKRFTQGLELFDTCRDYAASIEILNLAINAWDEVDKESGSGVQREEMFSLMLKSFEAKARCFLESGVDGKEIVRVVEQAVEVINSFPDASPYFCDFTMEIARKMIRKEAFLEASSCLQNAMAVIDSREMNGEKDKFDIVKMDCLYLLSKCYAGMKHHEKSVTCFTELEVSLLV